MVDFVLRRAVQSGKRIQLIYLDQNHRLTHRFVRVLKLTDDKVMAFCYLRRKPRWFERARILAAG
jgi:predicted DNA-binding transcriptional regulator YafY